MKFERIEIETERLKLRLLKSTDVNDVYEIFSDPEAMRYWSSPPMQEKSAAAEKISKVQQEYQDGEAICFGLEHRLDKKIIGTCSLFRIHETSKRAELGYILNRSYWRQGLMQEALKALLSHFFRDLEFNRLEAEIDPRNLGSKGMLLSLGFLKEGFAPHRWIINDEVSDSEFYGLLRRDWVSVSE